MSQSLHNQLIDQELAHIDNLSDAVEGATSVAEATYLMRIYCRKNVIDVRKYELFFNRGQDRETYVNLAEK